jgi:predicted acetyltransferase
MSASKLVRPDILYKDSYLEALREYHGEGRQLYNDYTRIESDFAAFIDELRAERGHPHQPFQHWVEPVPETVLWMVRDENYLGEIEIRHRLNWHLEKWGGHIHFSIRPSERNKGFGRKLLAKGKPFANYLGIERALITVAPTNLPAIRVCEACGATASGTTPATDQFPERLLYWLDCS